MALVCDCGCRIDISADERERLAKTGERLACPQCGKSRKLRPLTSPLENEVRSTTSKVDDNSRQLNETRANESETSKADKTRARPIEISWFWMTMGIGMPIVIGIAIAIAQYGTRSPVAIEAPKPSTSVRNRVVAKQEAPPKPAEIPPERGNEPNEDAPLEPEPTPVALQRSASGEYRIDRVTDKRGDGAFSGRLHRQIFVVYPNPPSEGALRKAVTEVYENALKSNRDPLGTLDVWIFETAVEVRDVVSGSPVAYLAHCRDGGTVAPGAETLVSVVLRKQSDRPTQSELELVRSFDKVYESFKSPLRDKALFGAQYKAFEKAAKERREELVKAYAVQFGLSELQVRRAIAKVWLYREGKATTDADLDYWYSHTW